MDTQPPAARLGLHAEAIFPEHGLDEKLASGKQLIVKLGLDPTAPDIHLGHSVQLRKLRQFQDLGHKVVLIVGDFTAKIGDPSGRSQTRPVLTDEEIKANAKTYKKQAGKILKTDKQTFQILFNSKWLSKIKINDLLHLMGSVTVSQILERDDFQKRIKAGQAIGLHEFLYPLLQGYDSYAVHADVELGGTDQTFNMLMGRFVQQHYNQQPQAVMTMPLIPGLDGTQKMSKSLGNYIGITDAPNDMYGKVMSVPDNLMELYTNLCTNLHWEELQSMKPMDAKKKLAFAIVELYHGKKAVAAQKAFEERFQERKLYIHDAPKLAVKGEPLLVDFLVEQKILPSKSEARRKMQEGAVQLHGEKATSLDTKIQFTKQLTQIPLKVGKKTFYTLYKAD